LRILLDYRPALRQRTGVGEYAHHLAAAMVARSGRDRSVTLFSSSWKDRLPPDTIPGAGRLDLPIPVRLLNLAWHRAGWPPVETFGADPEVVWSLHPLLMPSRSAAQVVTVHDLFFLDQPHATSAEIRRDYPTLAAKHARAADGVVVNSEYTRRLVNSRLEVPLDRISICYPGAPRWRPRPEPTAPGPILHMGTIEPRKNVGAIIKAYRVLVAQDGAAPPLLFAGRMTLPVETVLGAEDKQLLRDRILFVGYVTDAQRQRLYREASLLVIASTDEGFGLPALEAMTIGLPVVAAARGSLPEVVGDAGLLVDADNPVVLAAAMRSILDDANLRRELVDRGLQRSRRFEWDASAGLLLDAFRGAIARRALR
jgi:glycosyltransferase involved in cell wall biosynthesis